jgi:hypothetical protein
MLVLVSSSFNLMYNQLDARSFVCSKRVASYRQLSSHVKFIIVPQSRVSVQ